VLLSIVTAPVLIGQLLAQRAPRGAVALLAKTTGSASASATSP
jgi:hypothetical protein